jgi:hypothetical protein
VIQRDIKSANVRLTDDGRTVLIDFEHAGHPSGSGQMGGTRGYASPQQRRGEPATPADDVYAVGAVLLLLTSGVEPSSAPHVDLLDRRPLQLLRPDIDPRLEELITACLQPAREARPDLRWVAESIGRLNRRTTSSVTPGRSTNVQPIPPHVVNERIVELCDAIGRRAIRKSDDELTWLSTTKGTLPVPFRQINNGVPGVILGLLAGWQATGQQRHLNTAVHGARWLASAPPLPGAQIDGLYAGESGVGVSLLWAGLAAQDNSLIAAARRCEELLRQFPIAGTDLFHGVAGRIRFLLMLHSACGEDQLLDEALRLTGHLHRTAIPTAPGVAWPSHFANAQKPIPGYAHGAAGIADVLIDVYEATGDLAHLELAGSAARWIAHEAIPTLHDNSGLDWGVGTATNGWWCYGAAGVGPLFLRLSTLTAATERWGGDASNVALRAGRTVAAAGRHAGPGLCHGLGGAIEYLLDLAGHTGDERWIDRATELHRLLDAYRASPPFAGYPQISDEDSDISYLLGDAGTVRTLARLGTRDSIIGTLTVGSVQTFTAGPGRGLPTTHDAQSLCQAAEASSGDGSR